MINGIQNNITAKMNKISSFDRDECKLKTATNEVGFYIKDLIHVLCLVHGDRLFQVSLVLKQDRKSVV